MPTLKIKITSNNFSIELEGDTEIVEKHIDNFKEIIDNNLKNLQNTSRDQDNKRTETISDTKDENDLYKDIFDKDTNGNIKIITKLPGISKSEQTKNATLIYCFAKNISGTEIIPIEEIRTVCIDYGCYDTSNFALHIKSLKDLTIATGKNSKMTLKLTSLGKNTAESLIQNIRETK